MFIRQEHIKEKKRYKFESHIGWNTDWWNYYGQYKNVIDDIVNSVENNTPIDTVSLPLLFLIRHSLELGLKANILKLETVNTSVAKIKMSGTKYHSLEKLYQKFVEHLNVLKKKHKISNEIEKEINAFLIKLQPLINILNKLDEGSFNFRYPVDTNGCLNFSWTDKVNIADIVDFYYDIQSFIIFTENVLYDEGVFKQSEV